MIKIKNLVYSKQGKLFSIWRILRLIIISFFIALLISRLFGILSIPFNIYVRQPIAIICIIIVTILLDKETIDNLGIELKLKSVLLFIIGIAWAYFCCIQIEIVGFFTTDSGIQFANPFTKNALLSLGFLLISIALPEELLYRGYLISNVNRDTNPSFALLISFIIFTAVHFMSKAWTNVPVGLTFGFVFTLLLGLTFIMTKNIFLAIGFHGAWNAYNDLFNSDRLGISIILIIFLINTLGFYLVYRKMTNFDYKTLIRHYP